MLDKFLRHPFECRFMSIFLREKILTVQIYVDIFGKGLGG